LLKESSENKSSHSLQLTDISTKKDQRIEEQKTEIQELELNLKEAEEEIDQIKKRVRNRSSQKRPIPRIPEGKIRAGTRSQRKREARPRPNA